MNKAIMQMESLIEGVNQDVSKNKLLKKKISRRLRFLKIIFNGGCK